MYLLRVLTTPLAQTLKEVILVIVLPGLKGCCVTLVRKITNHTLSFKNVTVYYLGVAGN